jgi:hypothetical protein
MVRKRPTSEEVTKLDFFHKGIYPVWVLVFMAIGLSITVAKILLEQGKMQGDQTRMQREIDGLQEQVRQHVAAEQRADENAQELREHISQSLFNMSMSRGEVNAAAELEHFRNVERRRLGDQADELWNNAKNKAKEKLKTLVFDWGARAGA